MARMGWLLASPVIPVISQPTPAIVVMSIRSLRFAPSIWRKVSPIFKIAWSVIPMAANMKAEIDLTVRRNDAE
jgi:hypothetical protein